MMINDKDLIERFDFIEGKFKEKPDEDGNEETVIA